MKTLKYLIYIRCTNKKKFFHIDLNYILTKFLIQSIILEIIYFTRFLFLIHFIHQVCNFRIII